MMHHVRPAPAPSVVSVIVGRRSITTPLHPFVPSLPLLSLSDSLCLTEWCVEAAVAQSEDSSFTGNICVSCQASPIAFCRNHRFEQASQLSSAIMKLSSTVSACLLLLAPLQIAARSLSFFEFEQSSLKTGNGGLKVNGSNPLTYCSDPSQNILQIDSVDLSPNPPVAYVSPRAWHFFAILDNHYQVQALC